MRTRTVAKRETTGRETATGEGKQLAGIPDRVEVTLQGGSKSYQKLQTPNFESICAVRMKKHTASPDPIPGRPKKDQALPGPGLWTWAAVVAAYYSTPPPPATSWHNCVTPIRDNS